MADDLAALLAQIDQARAPEPLSVAENILGYSRSYLDGPTFNFEDNAEAGIAGLFRSLFSNDKSISENYADKLAEVRAQQDRFKAANPITSAITEIGSSLVLNPLGEINALAKTGTGAIPLAARFATGAPVQGGLAAAGMADGENTFQEAGKGAILGSATSAIANMFGRGMRAAGVNADRFKLSAFGVGSADISKQLRKMDSSDLASLGAVDEIPIVETLNKYEKAGVVDAGRSMLENFKNVFGTQKSIASALTGVLKSVDNVIPPDPRFNTPITDRFIGRLSGTAREKADAAATKEFNSLLSQMGSGTLQDFQKAKIGLNYKWDENPYTDDIIKALRSDLRQEIENRTNQAAKLGLVSPTVAGQVKSLNSEWGNLAELGDVFKKRIATRYGGNAIEDIISSGRTSGGVGTLNNASANTGNPIYAGLGALLTAARGPEALSTLGDVTRVLKNPLIATGEVLPEVVTGRTAAQAIGQFGGAAPQPTNAAADLSSLIQQIDAVRGVTPTEAPTVRPLDSVINQMFQVSPSGPQAFQGSQGQQGKSTQLPAQRKSPGRQASPDQTIAIPSEQSSAIGAVFQPSSKRDTMQDLPPKVAQVEQQIDADPYFSTLYEAESNRNPNAKNKVSSAAGGFQFIKSTAKAVGLDDPYDLGKSFKAVQKLTDQHRARFGEDPAVLYSAHYLGGTLLAKVLAGKSLTQEQQAQVDYLREKALPRFMKIYQTKESGILEA